MPTGRGTERIARTGFHPLDGGASTTGTGVREAALRLAHLRSRADIDRFLRHALR